MARSPRPIGLALQGGGALGAYGWGVLDRLLEDGRLAPRRISGASAGAMNGAVLAYALTVGDADLGRELLETFWRKTAAAGAFVRAAGAPWLALLRGAGLKDGRAVMDGLSRMTSPYDRARLVGSGSPLVELIGAVIDVERLNARGAVPLFVSATHVATGRARLFGPGALSAEVLAASACLPFLFPAVEIDGEAYWDGGYTANPALSPLVSAAAPADLVLIHLTPLTRAEPPRTADEIVDRTGEITFNAPLLAELRALAQRAGAAGAFAPSLLRSARRLRLHALDADAPLADAPAGSKTDTDLDALLALRDRGRAAAEAWLGESFRHVGRRASTPLSRFLS